MIILSLKPPDQDLSKTLRIFKFGQILVEKLIFKVTLQGLQQQQQQHRFYQDYVAIDQDSDHNLHLDFQELIKSFLKLCHLLFLDRWL